MTERMFPVLRGGDWKEYDSLGCPRQVPWSILAPHEGWAQRNHGQSLERLAERGGLGIQEMACIVTHVHWRKAPSLVESLALIRGLCSTEPP
jgi:hypothetical protein